MGNATTVVDSRDPGALDTPADGTLRVVVHPLCNACGDPIAAPTAGDGRCAACRATGRT